jgi:hypothetical protein
MALPRYFVPRAGVVAEVRPLGLVAFPLDVFAIEPAAAPAEEWLVGLDDAGLLAVQRTVPDADLLPLVREAVAFNEVSKGNVRALAQESLYALELSAFEGAPEAPAFDDAVYLHGVLVGPLVPGCREAQRIEGKLVVGRGDLLQGLLAGAEHSFLHLDRVTERTARTLHLLLPGDRAEVLAAGQGAVLAYPVVGPDTEDVGPGNEALVTEMLQDLIAAMRPEVARRERRPTLDRFLELAREALDQLPDWPDPRAGELLARLHPRPRPTPPPAAAPLPAPKPAPPAAAAQTLVPAPAAPDGLDRFIDGYDDKPEEEQSSFAELVRQASAQQRAPIAVEHAGPAKAGSPFASVVVEGSMVRAELSSDLFRASADVSLYIQSTIRAVPERARLVEETVRAIVESLAAKDRNGGVRTSYCSCGPQGMNLSLVGEVYPYNVSTYRFRGSDEEGGAARLLPALGDFVLQARYQTTELRGACAVFLLEGEVKDLSEVGAYSASMADMMASGELPRVGFILVPLLDDQTDRLKRLVSRLRGRDPWPLWECRAAEEARLVPQVLSTVIDKLTDDPPGATILDEHGNVLRTYPGRPPRVVTFQLPMNARNFVLVLRGQRHVERLDAPVRD